MSFWCNNVHIFFLAEMAACEVLDISSDNLKSSSWKTWNLLLGELDIFYLENLKSSSWTSPWNLLLGELEVFFFLDIPLESSTWTTWNLPLGHLLGIFYFGQLEIFLLDVSLESSWKIFYSNWINIINTDSNVACQCFLLWGASLKMNWIITNIP